MPPKSQSEVETDIIDSALQKHKEQCPYRKEKDLWLSAQMLKISGVVIGLLSPLFVWIVVSIFTMQAELAVQKEKMGTILEIRQDIQAIKNDINQLKIDVSVLKSKGTP